MSSTILQKHSLKRAAARALSWVGAHRFAFVAYEWFQAKCVGLPVTHGSPLGEVTNPIPPPYLIVKVAGSPDVKAFLEGGRQGFHSLVTILERNHLALSRFRVILDYGCGCGRVARFIPREPQRQLYGSDYNQQLVEWCRQNLPVWRFEVNQLAPPLAYSPSSFDLIYAFSVFTHMSLELQHKWMRELGRVLIPGGYLVLSLQGEAYVRRLSSKEKSQFERALHLVRYPEASGTNLCSVYHTPAFVKNVLAAEWDVVDWIPEGATGSGSQDLYLLRKPGE